MGCETCGGAIPARSETRGRRRRYCSNACRQRAYREHRAVSFPAVMQQRAAWVRCVGKRPVRIDGRPASTVDPSTWASFDAVTASTAGDGFGIMLGGGLGCYDLDHVTDEAARRFIATISEPVILVERSVSGTGVHVFVEAQPAPGWKRVIDGLHIERYSRARFIRTTGKVFVI